jgi:CheY-like chemotaxis protein
VHGFATQLGGTVTLDSAPGRGTTVAIWLPRAAAAAPAPDDTAPAGATPTAALRVLAVDDDPGIRALVAEMLTDLGHSVTTAAGGPEAMAMLAAGAAVDLLLLDFAMSPMNGARIAEAALRRRPDLPILFMTGYADPSALGSWVERGYPVLRKPFGARDLALALRQVVETHARTGPSLPRTREG